VTAARSVTRSSILVAVLVGCQPPPRPAPVVAVATQAGEAQPDGSVAEADDVALSDESDMEFTEGGVGIQELRVGKGVEAKPGMRLRVHYVGRLADGTEFDSSRERGESFAFELGDGIVLKGWDEGLAGMRVGGIRRLIVPSTLGYGKRGDPPKIPPNAVLEFDVELLEAE